MPVDTTVGIVLTVLLFAVAILQGSTTYTGPTSVGLVIGRVNE